MDTYDIFIEETSKINSKLDKEKEKIFFYFKKLRGVFITFIILSTLIAISVPVIVIIYIL